MLMNCDQYYDLKQEIVYEIYDIIDNDIYCFLYQGDLEYTVWYNPFTHKVSSYPETTTFIKIEGKFDIAKAREEDDNGNYFDSLLAYAQDNFNQRINFGLTTTNDEYNIEIGRYEADRPKNFQKMVSEMASQCMREFLNHNQVEILAGDDYVALDDIQAILEDRRKQYKQIFTLGDNQNYSHTINSEQTNSNEAKITLNLDDDSSFQDLVKRVEKLENLVTNMTSLLKDWPSFL